MNGLTPRGAFDLLGLAPGQTVSVTGAAVGGYAVELGTVLGLCVIAVAASDDEAFIRSTTRSRGGGPAWPRDRGGHSIDRAIHPSGRPLRRAARCRA
jgi:hypothetical protein